jgi:60 kDa SS-A/Ro ribonucleoprotein
LVKNAKMSGTNFNAIFETAKRAYDRIIILSDMQGWMGGGAPTKAFADYKARYNADPFVYSFDLQGYGSLQFPEPKVFAVAGFSEKVLELMGQLERDPQALIRAIEAVELA